MARSITRQTGSASLSKQDNAKSRTSNLEKKSTASSEVENFKAILGKAKKGATRTYTYASGNTLTVKGSEESGLHLQFTNGRVIATTDDGATYRDSAAPDLSLTNLSVDFSDGSITYVRLMGKRSVTIKESADGATYATIKSGRDQRQIQLQPDLKRVYIGKEGTMEVASDGSYVALQPRKGGLLKLYPWSKLIDVEFPDGYKQTFYASDKELGLLKRNPVGFYVNWLPADKQGRHFEWGTIEFS